MAKRFDPKAKARKQKIVAAVLGVLLLGVLVFQAPTIMGLFKGSSSTVKSEPAPSTATTTPTATGTPTPVSNTPAASSSSGLTDSDLALEPGTGQLVAFDRFESKDPFAPQLTGGSTSPPPPSAPNKRKPPEGANPPPPPPSPPPAPSESRTATISVNGVPSRVSVSATFPEGDPIFKLVSLTRRQAKVGIVDGSYATGAAAITLTKGGKPVTLMNTADGTTYVLRLVSVG